MKFHVLLSLFILLSAFTGARASGLCEMIPPIFPAVNGPDLGVPQEWAELMKKGDAPYLRALDFIFQRTGISTEFLRKQTQFEEKFKKLLPAIETLTKCLNSEGASLYPKAISISLTAFIDAGVGAEISTEFLFFPAEDGQFYVIQYLVKGGRVGASAQVGAEISMGFIYGLNKPEDYDGYFVSVGASVEDVFGGGIEIYSSIPSKSDFAKLTTLPGLADLIMFGPNVVSAIVVGGNVGAGAGVLGTVTYYTEIAQWNQLVTLW